MFKSIQYISQGNTAKEQLYQIESVLDTGIEWIQYRFKNVDNTILYHTAEKVKQLCETYKATLIVNDHPEIAIAIDADGVHLGLQDMSIDKARKLLPNKIIGGTANTLIDVKQRIAENCNYIGLGPLRFTHTKEKLSPVLGIEGYKTIIESVKSENNTIPIVAIGGITLTDLPYLKQIQVDGIAVSSLLYNAKQPQQIVQHIKQYFL